MLPRTKTRIRTSKTLWRTEGKLELASECPKPTFFLMISKQTPLLIVSMASMASVHSLCFFWTQHLFPTQIPRRSVLFILQTSVQNTVHTVFSTLGRIYNTSTVNSDALKLL